MHAVDVAAGALALPRDQWQDHPNYPRHALLLGSHDNFRRISTLLVTRARNGGDAPGIGWVFRAWKAAMHSHERYEEHKLYPYLEARWGLSTDRVRQGHRELSELEIEVLAAADAPGPASAHLSEALRAHDAALREHLALEEDLVIPALLALTPDEFEDYYQSDIRGLLQRLRPQA